MKRLTIPTLAAALGALCALQANAEQRQIDWGTVPGGHGRNDVSRDFVATPDPLNVILSNSFTAWEPNQKIIAQARTTTGRGQRYAVLGNPNAMASNVSYNESTVTTTQAAPSRENETLYSETPSSSQAGEVQQSQVEQKKTEQRTASTEGGAAKSDAKSRLAPHALIIESSLNSAIDQVHGIKGELGVTQDIKKTDNNAVQSYKTFIREIRSDINMARTQERQLMNESRHYPEVAKSNELKSVEPALRDVENSLKKWESKANNAQYWNNQTQAKADIDNIEKQLSNALDKVKSFSSRKLNTSSVS